MSVASSTIRIIFRLILTSLVLSCVQVCGTYEDDLLMHVQSFEGQVGSGNFTYYKLTLDGCVVIRLDSLLGDADLYVSSSSMKPTWDTYEFKSTTCGVDEIIIYPSQPRPVGIGVYGYIMSDLNTFAMSVYVDPYYVNPYQEPEDSDGLGGDNGGEKTSPVSPGAKPQTPYAEEEEQESLLWTIFIGFLKLLFDVLL